MAWKTPAGLLEVAAAPEVAPIDGEVLLLPAVLRWLLWQLRCKLGEGIAGGGSERGGEASCVLRGSGGGVLI